MTNRRAVREPVADRVAWPHRAAAEPTLFELRSYDAAPGRRDELIDMFERSFLDAYEAGGARIVATFTDIDRPDRWVWIRAFQDGESRRRALSSFYGGAAWTAGRAAANAAIARTRSALLLRAFSGEALAGPAQRSPAIIEATVYTPPPQGEAAFADAFDREAAPFLRALGGAPFATFVTDRRPNTFPRQRVRKKAAVVTLTRFPSSAAHDAFIAARDSSVDWRTRIAPALSGRRAASIEMYRLQPTSRSMLR